MSLRCDLEAPSPQSMHRQKSTPTLIHCVFLSHPQGPWATVFGLTGSFLIVGSLNSQLMNEPITHPC